RIGRPRQHAVFGGEPTLALPFEERRHFLVDAGGAQHARISSLDQNGAFRVPCVAAGDADGPQLIGFSATGSHAGFRSEFWFNYVLSSAGDRAAAEMSRGNVNRSQRQGTQRRSIIQKVGS